MMTCPYCFQVRRQVKTGRNPSGSQRFQCQHCRRVYTPKPSPNGYPRAVQQQAVRLYQSGMSFRAVARSLGVGTQSVINWVRNQTNTL